MVNRPSVVAEREQRAVGNEKVFEGQKRALELAVHGAPLRAVLEELVRTVESQSTQHVLASILLLDADGQHLREGAAPSLPAEYNAAIDGIEIGPTQGSCGTAAFTAKPVVVADVQTDPLWSAFKELAGKHGLRACWSMPIFSTSNAVLGTFALYHRVVATPTDRDREVVELLAHTAALVIERDANAARRSEAEAALRRASDEQAARLAAIFHHAPAAIALLRGPDHVFEVANPSYERLVSRRSLIGKSVREAFPELSSQGIFDLLDGVRASGKPYTGHAQRVLLRLVEGQPLVEGFYDFVYQPLPGPDGKIDSILVLAFDVTAQVTAKQEVDAALQASRALTLEVSEQSRAAQQALLEMRAAKEQAELRLSQLEAERREAGRA